MAVMTLFFEGFASLAAPAGKAAAKTATHRIGEISFFSFITIELIRIYC